MIPTTNSVLSSSFAFERMPSEQHRMINGRIIGHVDELEALRQSIYKILNTQRYAYVIYSWNYGIELSDLYGMSTVKACPLIKNRIKEALMQDDRITKVSDFEFNTSKRGVISVKFTVQTVFGDVEMDEVIFNV